MDGIIARPEHLGFLRFSLSTATHINLTTVHVLAYDLCVVTVISEVQVPPGILVLKATATHINLTMVRVLAYDLCVVTVISGIIVPPGVLVLKATATH